MDPRITPKLKQHIRDEFDYAILKSTEKISDRSSLQDDPASAEEVLGVNADSEDSKISEERAKSDVEIEGSDEDSSQETSTGSKEDSKDRSSLNAKTSNKGLFAVRHNNDVVSQSTADHQFRPINSQGGSH